MKSDRNIIIALVVVSILLCAATYMWATKPVEIINTDTDRIEQLESENALLQQFLTDTLEKQDAYFNAKLIYSDSVIKAKRINNWNLIIRHEKELAEYKTISTDSAFVLWSILSRTDRLD